MIIVGIDPSIDHTALGVLTIEDGELVGASAQVVKRKKGVGDGRYLWEVFHDAASMLIHNHIRAEIAIEGVHAGPWPKAGLRLSEVIGAARLWAAHEGVALSVYSPTAIKKSVTGTGGATKPMVQEHVRLALRQLSEDIGRLTYDESDALATALTQLAALRGGERQAAKEIEGNPFDRQR